MSGEKERSLGDLLWREACVDDCIRQGMLRGNARILTKGYRKLGELLEAGFEPRVSDRPADLEQAKRIRNHVANIASEA